MLEKPATVISIIVYDRLINVKRWLACLQTCNKMGAKVAVIHNYDGASPSPDFEAACKHYGTDYYIPRPNIGLDIGAFQDVVKERLEGFPTEWEYLIWLCDDGIPMVTHWVSVYMNCIMRPGVGACGNEISHEFLQHLRTHAFAIKKDVANRLTFNVDPIITKDDCFEFEHRHNNMLRQVHRMGLTVEQVAQYGHEIVWDTGHRAHVNAWGQHFNVFPVSQDLH